MRYLMLIAAFLASTTWAAPSVVASQSTATSGTSHVLAVPAGAAGDLLVAVVAGDYSKMGASFNASGTGWSTRAPSACSRGLGLFYKVSDGSESTLTVTSSTSLSVQVLIFRISGNTSASLYGWVSQAFNFPMGTNAPDSPGIGMPGTADTLFVTGTFYNGAAPVLHPSGYGFPLDAQNTVNLSLSFLSANSNSDDPGAFSLASSVKACAFGFGIY